MSTKHTQDLETITRAYLVCALWSSTGDDGEPLDASFDLGDIADESKAQAQAEIADFLGYCEETGVNPFVAMDCEQIGHDFCLTRNGHGAGFWDRGLGDLGRKLTDATKTFGSSDAYVGDDGKVYLT